MFNKIKKIISVLLLLSLTYSISYADDKTVVKTYINNMRNSPYSSGILGDIFTKVFDTNGQIKDIFLSFVNTLSDGYIPFGNEGQLIDSPIYTSLGKVGIGTTNLTEVLTISGGLSITKSPNTGTGVGNRDFNDARYQEDIAAFSCGYGIASILDDGSVTCATNNDTWRGIQNVLTSTSTTDSLSAAQGKWLNDNKLGITEKASDSNLLDGIDSTGFTKTAEVNNLGTVTFNQVGTTTVDFIAKLTSLGAFNSNHSTMKASWSYAGNQDLSDTGFGAVELAGSIVETWKDGSYIHIRLTRPTTGAGGGMILVYNDQSSGYSPGWRQIWTSTTDGTGSGLDADTLDGIDSTSFLRKDINDTFSGLLSVGSTLLRQAGIYGIYDSYKIGHIWSMGIAYKIAADGSNFGNLYGLAYKHTNNTTGGTMAGGHQMVWTQNGVGTSAMGTNIWTSGTIRAGDSAILSTGGPAGYYQDSVNGAYRSIVSSVTTNGYYFQTNGGGTTTMYVGLGGTYNNRVGIGTNAPNYTLDVNGTANVDYLRVGVGAHTSIILEDDESPNGVKYIHANSDNIGFLSGAGGWIARWDNAGNQVNSGYVTAAGFLYSSDKRLKTNIKPLENSKDILKIDAVRFDWIKDGKKDVGIIAQTVEKYFPEFVETTESGYKIVDYPKLVVPLMKVVQNQQIKIDDLEKRLKILEEKIK